MKAPCPFQIEMRSSYGSVKIRGPVYRMIDLPVGVESPVGGGPITRFTPDWARIGYELVSPCATMQRPRESGHDFEGRVTVGGKSYSAFTSGGVDDGRIIIRSKR